MGEQTGWKDVTGAWSSGCFPINVVAFLSAFLSLWTGSNSLGFNHRCWKETLILNTWPFKDISADPSNYSLMFETWNKQTKQLEILPRNAFMSPFISNFQVSIAIQESFAFLLSPNTRLSCYQGGFTFHPWESRILWLPLQSVRWLNFRGGYLRNVWLPWWLSGKESACDAGDSGSIPGLERSPREGKGNPLQYSCLGNPMDRGAWWAAVQGVAKSWT